jgi:hypothetical protein
VFLTSFGVSLVFEMTACIPISTKSQAGHKKCAQVVNYVNSGGAADNPPDLGILAFISIFAHFGAFKGHYPAF